MEESLSQHAGDCASLEENAEKQLVVETVPGSHDVRLSKLAVRSVGTASTRSNTPSTIESLFDNVSAATSVASPSSMREYPFLTTELQVPTQCYRRYDSEDNIFRIPELMDTSDNLRFDTSACDIPSIPPGNEYARILPIRSMKQANNIDPVRREGGSDFEDDVESNYDDDDDEWSGEPDRIERAVLTNVEDLEFAAWLIVGLHKDQNHREERRIGGWQRGIIKYQNSPESGEGSQHIHLGSGGDNEHHRSRKRRRLSNSRCRGSDDGDGEDRDDDEGNGSPENHDEGSIPEEPRGRYACPLNKSDPVKFCSNPVTGDQYRVCESGFKTIQRLKEQIKRKHLIIQCERCNMNFSGKGKAEEQSLMELRRHRQQAASCTLAIQETNDGVSMEQWTLLDRSGGKKRQKKSEVEKWFDIWDTIYPGVAHPAHPWAERTTPGVKPMPAQAYSQDFTSLFQRFLDHGTMSGNIQFLPGQEQLIRSRLSNYVLRAYNIHTALRDTPSLGNSSSSGQTATQVMPTTPIMPSSNMPNTTTRQLISPKNSRHGGQ
ncbi:hypothetical protein F4806DRAFT_496550 [Annulohypoxylon nitens]|nr:hypothetical protein F4806DRAFT_496550 [Annulohypoxylon nitens]